MQRTASLVALAAGFTLFSVAPAHAQYTPQAGKNAAYETVTIEKKDSTGQIRRQVVKRKVQADRYGNAQGNQFDLAVDGAFEGQTVAVLHFYTAFDFSLPKAALKQKGFSVYRWVGSPPSPQELEAKLEKACQLWIISDMTQKLNEKHLRVIKKFFDSGKGVYIWGDNQPYYADANYVAQALFDGEMKGNLYGDKPVGIQTESKQPGLMPNHLLTTGLEHIYEGITIATIQPNQSLKPLIYGSAGNLVTAYYDHGGKRAVLDGGFTRLYNKWDTAGTARYVKNAAAWLVNAERFGDDVIAKKQ